MKMAIEKATSHSKLWWNNIPNIFFQKNCCKFFACLRAVINSFFFLFFFIQDKCQWLHVTDIGLQRPE